jgi:photosystem II stability/assembly factor-like uncharacterized protein
VRKALGAAALGCGIFFSGAACAADAMPQAGPVPAATVQRLLLLDARVVGRKIVAVGDHGYIVISEDAGKSWRRAKAPAAPLLTGVDFSGEHGLAVGHDTTILSSDDGGETWTQRFSDPKAAGPLLDVAFITRDFAIAVGAYGAYYESNDGGKTWAARKIIAEDKHFNAIIPLGENRLMILGEAGTILASNDNGKSWSAVASPYQGSFFGAQVAADGAIVAYGMRGHIYRSKDQGKSWQAVDNASVFSLLGSERLADGSIVLAGGGGTALVSRDNGVTFQPIVTKTTRTFAKPLPGGESTVLLLGEAGARDAALAVKR